MKTILFPTDFSMNATHAIRYGLNLFKGKDVKFILFNAYQDSSMGTSMTYTFENHMQQVSMQMLEKLHETLIDDFGLTGYDIHLENHYGDLLFGVQRLMENETIDLIIMGNSGANSPNFSVFGRNSFAAMRDLQCPVLSIPLQAKIKIPSKIALASEKEMSGDEDFLQPLVEVASLHNTPVVGLRVAEYKEVASGMVIEGKEMQSDKDLPYINLNSKDPMQGIELAIGEYDVDMISVIMHQKSLMERLFKRSISKMVVKEIAIPILALHVD